MDPQVFFDIEHGQLANRVEDYKKQGWRFVNLCGSTVESGVELMYTFSAGEELENLRFVVENDAQIGAVSTLFPNAFVFENEVHDLYGIEFKGSIVDFKGRYYVTSIPTPMNPSSKAAKQFLEDAPKADETAAPVNETGEEASRG